MKKLSLLVVMAIAIAGIFVSCQNEDAPKSSDEIQTMDVVFQAKADGGLSLEKTDVNPEAYGDDFINIAISKLYLKAEHLISGTITNGEYTTVKDGSGANDIRLEDVPVGRNAFSAYTKSYFETPLTDPRPPESDGFSSWNKYPKNISGDPSVEVPVDTLVKRLRHDLPPYVTFKSNEVVQELLYAGCEDGDPTCFNTVELDMKAEQGRKIVTVQFEDVAQAQYYWLKATMTHDCDAGPAPAAVVDVNHVQGVNLPFAWFYLTHPSLTDATELNVKIELFEKGSNKVLGTWVINSKNPLYAANLSAKVGVDSWTNIIIDKETLSVNCVGVLFNWEWSNEDNEIIIGDCNGDGVVDNKDNC